MLTLWWVKLQNLSCACGLADSVVIVACHVMSQLDLLLICCTAGAYQNEAGMTHNAMKFSGFSEGCKQVPCRFMFKSKTLDSHLPDLPSYTQDLVPNVIFI